MSGPSGAAGFDVMQDLETLGTEPGSIILSIGAVVFNETTGLGQTFYTPISIASSLQHGLTIQQDTIDWWKDRKPGAQKVIIEALSPSAPTLPEGLSQFSRWLGEQAPASAVRLWGNGSDFDNVLLAAAYRAVGLRLPWRFWNGRCFRTLKSLYPGHEPLREGEHHNALDDALHQARHAVAIARATRVPTSLRAA